MVITTIARVAPRRQTIILARPTPAYVRSFSFWDLFRWRKKKTTDSETTLAETRDESPEEQTEQFKETYRDRLVRRKAQRAHPEEKEPYRKRHGPKWAEILVERLERLQDRQRTYKDIPFGWWREIGRLHNTTLLNFSRIHASSEGFLTHKEKMHSLIKQEVAWGDIVSLFSSSLRLD